MSLVSPTLSRESAMELNRNRNLEKVVVLYPYVLHKCGALSNEMPATGFAKIRLRQMNLPAAL